jgi:hypothetical protein
MLGQWGIGNNCVPLLLCSAMQIGEQWEFLNFSTEQLAEKFNGATGRNVHM